MLRIAFTLSNTRKNKLSLPQSSHHLLPAYASLNQVYWLNLLRFHEVQKINPHYHFICWLLHSIVSKQGKWMNFPILDFWQTMPHNTTTTLARVTLSICIFFSSWSNKEDCITEIQTSYTLIAHMKHYLPIWKSCVFISAVFLFTKTTDIKINLVCSLALKYYFLQLHPSVTLILTVTFISIFVNAHWISRTEDGKTCRNNVYYSLMVGESGSNKFHSSRIKMGITPGLILTWLLSNGFPVFNVHRTKIRMFIQQHGSFCWVVWGK